eukprot:8156891-Pyramimonas_sp.AAC.1
MPFDADDGVKLGPAMERWKSLLELGMEAVGETTSKRRRTDVLHAWTEISDDEGSDLEDLVFGVPEGNAKKAKAKAQA